MINKIYFLITSETFEFSHSPHYYIDKVYSIIYLSNFILLSFETDYLLQWSISKFILL